MGKKQLKQRIAELERQVANLEAELAQRPQWQVSPFVPQATRTITFPEYDPSLPPVGDNYPYKVWCVTQ